MDKLFHAHCACGKVTFEAKRDPLARIACYCDDCQAAGKSIDARPSGHSGMRADGGTVSTLYRKDLVRCTNGSDHLLDYKLRPTSPASRVIATCCNSNMLTKFDNWLPMVALRTHSQNVESVVPAMCINTRWAPDLNKIAHSAPRYAKIPPRLGIKVAASALYLALPTSLQAGV
jgi:hypothetical protein